MFCTKNAYTVGGGASASLEGSSARAHSDAAALGHGRQSLLASARHANSFFFSRQTHRESLLFAKCQNRYTFLNVMLFK